jgi:uncharacterized membrane protein
MTKEQTISIKSYIQVFIAALLIVFGMSFLMENQGNQFTNMGATSFIISGILIIIKETWEYKKRKHYKENR